MQSNRLYSCASSTWLQIGVALALLVALLLPLGLLAGRRFHHDEALYATWALQISSGENPWLAETPVDKPPLFIYIVAGAFRLLGVSETSARLPSLLATLATVGLTFALGRRLYGSRVGLLAAWLVALSPLTIAFAPTALTDPLLVALVLGSCLAAISGWAGWAGLAWGLAIATKQQGLFFGPLVVGLLILTPNPSGEETASRPSGRAESRQRRGEGQLFPESKVHFGLRARKLLLFGLVAVLVALFTLLWDAARHQSPGVWQLSLINYGGLSAGTVSLDERAWGFLELLQLSTGSRVLNAVFAVGLPLLLLYGLWQIWRNSRNSLSSIFQNSPPAPLLPRSPAPPLPFATDWLLTLFMAAFLLGHILLSFQVWDRYLLGLVPLLALLLARVLLLPGMIWNRGRAAWRTLGSGLLLVFLAVTLSHPVQDAVNGRYPLGSNSAALSGLEQITAYLQGHRGANTTLYHRWLGTHWRFYLWGYPYDLQYWQSPQALAAKAQPGHLIAFPAWRSETEARLALAEVGLHLVQVAQAYDERGAPSITLYRIELIEEG